MGIRRALIVLLVAMVVAGVAAPSLLAAPTLADTPAPTATATLSAGYQYPLSSGQTLTVWARMSFGEMFNSAAMAALLLAFVVYVIYKVIERWT